MNDGYILVEKFDSIDEYVRVIGERPVNSVFSSRKNNLSSNIGSRGFTGTSSYNESVALIERGYIEGLNDLHDNGTIRLNHKTSRHIPSTAPVGYAPVVPNAILGLPNSMITRKPVLMNTKVVSIWYDISASGNVDKKMILEAGRHVLELVNFLEVSGYRVELRIMDSYCNAEQLCFVSVKVKTDRQPLVPLKISYPLLHSSFMRRQGFRWLETYPKLTSKSFVVGYGAPLNTYVRDSRGFLRRKGVLGRRDYFTDFYEAKEHDAKELVKLIGLK